MSETHGQMLVAYAPCGCMFALILTDAFTPAEQATYYKEWLQDGATRVETLSHQEYLDRGGLVTKCQHDPQWGGMESTHANCPRCDKRVKKKKNGGLYSHKGRGGYFTCSQQVSA